MNVYRLLTYVVVRFYADDTILYIISQTKNQALSKLHLF